MAEELIAEKRSEYYTARRELLAASSTAAQQNALERWSFSPEDPAVVFAQARVEAEVEAEEAMASRDCVRLRKALKTYPKDGISNVKGPVIRAAVSELPKLEKELELAREAVEGYNVEEWKYVAQMLGEGEIAKLIARARELLSQHNTRDM
jgi:hypothetical protein